MSWLVIAGQEKFEGTLNLLDGVSTNYFKYYVLHLRFAMLFFTPVLSDMCRASKLSCIELPNLNI